MQYTISSRGRPIGSTELDFFRLGGSARSGWFHPNALGEVLMPTAALVYPAMCAFVNRNVRGEDGQPIVLPSFRDSSLFADIAEALHRVDALELTLHHPDGTLIPTSLIGIQDTEQLLDLATWVDVWPERDPAIAEEEWDEELDREIEHDVDVLSRGWQPGDDDLPESPLDESAFDDLWIRYEEPSPQPRYQVHLLLSAENVIP